MPLQNIFPAFVVVVVVVVRQTKAGRTKNISLLCWKGTKQKYQH
jgi:hypothetical protein